MPPETTHVDDTPQRRATDRPLTKSDADGFYMTHQTFNRWAGGMIAVLLVMAGGFAVWILGVAKDAPVPRIQQLEAKVDQVEKNTAEKLADHGNQIRALDTKLSGEIAKVENLVRTSESRVLQEVAASRQDLSNLTQLLLTGKIPRPVPSGGQ